MFSENKQDKNFKDKNKNYDENALICKNIEFDVATNRVTKGYDLFPTLKQFCLHNISITLWKNNFINTYQQEKLITPISFKFKDNWTISTHEYNDNFLLQKIKKLNIPSILTEEILHLSKSIFLQLYYIEKDIYDPNFKYAKKLFENVSWTIKGMINHQNTYQNLKRNKVDETGLLKRYELSKKEKAQLERCTSNLSFFEFLLYRKNPTVLQQFWKDFLKEEDKIEILCNVNKLWWLGDLNTISFLLSNIKYKYIFNENLSNRVIIVEILNSFIRMHNVHSYVLNFFDQVKELMFVSLNLNDGISVLMEFVNSIIISQKLIAEIWFLFEYSYSPEIESNQRSISEIILESFTPHFNNQDFFKRGFLKPKKWLYHFQELMFETTYGIKLCKSLIKLGCFYDILIESIFFENPNDFKKHFWKSVGTKNILAFAIIHSDIKQWIKFCNFFKNEIKVYCISSSSSDESNDEFICFMNKYENTANESEKDKLLNYFKNEKYKSYAEDEEEANDDDTIPKFKGFVGNREAFYIDYSDFD